MKITTLTKHLVLLVSEDERLINALQKNVLLKLSNKINLVVTPSIFEAKFVMKSQQVDVILLDVHLSLVNGLELLKNTEHIAFKTIVFSKDSKLVSEALKLNVVDYLIKPISSDIIFDTFTKITHAPIIKTTINKNQIVINNKSEFKILEPNDIIWIEAENNYSKIHTKTNEVHQMPKTLAYYDKLLQHKHFYRIHKSHLINTFFLKTVEKTIKNKQYAVMNNNQKLIISNLKHKKFKQTLLNSNESV